LSLSDTRNTIAICSSPPQLGLKLDKVKIDIDGDVDLRGFFGLDDPSLLPE